VADRTVTVKPSGGDYTTLAAAIAAEVAANADLTSDNGSGSAGILNVEIDGDWSGGADTAAVSIAGFTVSADYYVHIYTTAAARHNGKWDTGAYRLVTATSCLVCSVDYTRIEGLQFDISSSTASSYSNCNLTTAIGSRISNCIAKWSGTTSSTGHCFDIDGGATAATPCLIWNCIAYDAPDYGFQLTGAENDSIYVYNCTAIGCVRGYYTSYGDTIAKNCVGFGNSDVAFYGTYDGTSTKNAYDNGSDPGSAGVDISAEVGTDLFADYNADDFHLKSGSALIGAGADDPGSGLYSDDIDGDSRVSTWDIGADEYVAAGGISPTGALDGPLVGALGGPI